MDVDSNPILIVSQVDLEAASSIFSFKVIAPGKSFVMVNAYKQSPSPFKKQTFAS